MAFDFKKEYREFYLPGNRPELVDVPGMNFLAVRGRGDPNEAGGEYGAAVGLLYGVAYTIRMSGRGGRRIAGWFDYVVPPLEGLWWQEGVEGFDARRKGGLSWVSLIRLPDFVGEDDAAWAIAEAGRKKKADYSRVTFYPFTEGLCVQCMHLGPFDTEPATVRAMEAHALAQGCVTDIGPARRHHEIYLSDVTKGSPDKWKTVVRHPVRKA